MSGDSEKTLFDLVRTTLLAHGYFKTVRLWNNDFDLEDQGKIQAILFPAAFIYLGDSESSAYYRNAQKVTGQLTIHTGAKYTGQDQDQIFSMSSALREALHLLQGGTISLEKGASRFSVGFDKVAVKETDFFYTYIENQDKAWTLVTPTLGMTTLMDRTFGRPGVAPEIFQLLAVGAQDFTSAASTTGVHRLLIQGSQSFSSLAVGHIFGSYELSAQGSQTFESTAYQIGVHKLSAVGSQAFDSYAHKLGVIQLAAVGSQSFNSTAVSAGVFKLSAIGSQDFTATAYQIGVFKILASGSQAFNSTAVGTKVGASSFLLDTYTGAAVAFSLRQLKTGVTNVCRVRRSSDDDESDFTAAEITDGTLTAWTGANNFSVVTFYDESGNTGRDNNESVAANQFTLGLSGVLNTLNTKPVVLGSGINAYNSYNISPFKHDTGFTLVFVGKTDLVSRNKVVASGPTNFMFQLDSNGTLDIRNGLSLSGGDSGVGSNQAIFQVYIRETEGCLIRANKNAAALDTTTGVFTDSAMNYLLSALSELQMQEIICWPTNLESQKDEITDAINSYYGIY